MEESPNVSNIFVKFSKKLDSFSRAEENQRKIVRKENKNAFLKSRIAESEEEKRNKIIETYRAFKIPSSRGTEEDEEALLKAYELFKTLQEMKEKSGKEKVFIRRAEIYAPFCEKDFYFSDDKIIFLIAWLKFEKNITDYVPFIVSTGTSSPYLDFAEAETFRYSPEQKEIIAVIQDYFYRG